MTRYLQAQLGLHNLWILYYFIYIYALEFLQFVAFWVALFTGFANSNWVTVFTNTWQ